SRAPSGRLSSPLSSPPPTPLFPYTTLFRSPPPCARCGRPRRLDRRRRAPPSARRVRQDRLGRGRNRALRPRPALPRRRLRRPPRDRKSTRLNSSHQIISYAVFCLKKKNDV